MLRLLLSVLLAAPALAAGPPAMTPAREALTGVVAEVLPAGTYCYVRLADTWLATMGACPSLGGAAVAQVFGWRNDFASPRLGRVFPRLGFALITPQET